MRKSAASHPRTRGLRVVVTTGAPPPNPFSWVVVDGATGSEVRRSARRFPTLSLAWEDGVSVLGTLPPDKDEPEWFEL
jgi:hypothetical protein